jgi:CxxC motif-containing protein (DUF1111 family)
VILLGLAVLLTQGAHIVSFQSRVLGDGPGANGPKVDRGQRAKGRELFARQWVTGDQRSHGGDGLGPVYNERSCLNCHDQGGPGGAGGADKNIELITPASASNEHQNNPAFFYAFSFSYGPEGFEYHSGNPAAEGKRDVHVSPPILAELVQIHPGFRSAPSVVLHRYGNDRDYRAWRDWVLGKHGTIALKTSQRSPTPLFGLGLVDAIADDVIEAGAKHRQPGWPGVHGRVSRLPDGRIGRFGWKAQMATLREFVVSAAAVELGLEVPGHPQAADPRIPALPVSGMDMDQEETDALISYVRALPAPLSELPPNVKDARTQKAGKALFKSIGCAACHVPKLGETDGLYSDLLLHEMSPELNDTGIYGAFLAGPRDAAKPAPAVHGGQPGRPDLRLSEWRTPPLWGLRDSAPYLHDGRAPTIEQAILLHGGEAAASAQRYRALSPRERNQLERFLLSLIAPLAPAPDNLARNGK